VRPSSEWWGAVVQAVQAVHPFYQNHAPFHVLLNLRIIINFPNLFIDWTAWTAWTTFVEGVRNPQFLRTNKRLCLGP